jgi:hypothetical protein
VPHKVLKAITRKKAAEEDDVCAKEQMRKMKVNIAKKRR